MSSCHQKRQNPGHATKEIKKKLDKRRNISLYSRAAWDGEVIKEYNNPNASNHALSKTNRLQLNTEIKNKRIKKRKDLTRHYIQDYTSSLAQHCSN